MRDAVTMMCTSQPTDPAASAVPTTYHAPAERVSNHELDTVVSELQQEPIIQAMLDAHPEIAVILNPERQIVACNQALLALVGAETGREVVGRRLGEVLGCIHAGELPGGCGTSETCQTCGAVNAVLGCQDSGTCVRDECRISTGDPSRPDSWDLEVVVTPLHAGNLRLMILAARDIASTKRREVFERFFFHDTLNLAGGIKGLAEMLETGEAFDPHSHPRRLHAMAHHLIEQLRTQRDLAAAERGELVPNWSVIRVRDLFHDLQATYAAHPVARDRLLCFEPPAPWDASLQSDHILLGRVIGNLVKNALEASAPGQAVTVAFAIDGSERVRFTVHNPAVMPRRVQLQIFKRSFSTKHEKGRGLGTFSVKLLTSRYLGGAVGFSSTEGAGTTFTISLPRWRTAAEGLPDQPGIRQEPEAALTGCRVLLAEDDPDNRRLITHFLRKAGAQAVVAENGRQAVDAALSLENELQGAFDVILMDMEMPVMDGYEATRSLRAAGYNGRIIALTAHATTADQRTCIAAGCDDYAAKPIDRVTLLEAVRRHARLPTALSNSGPAGDLVHPTEG